MDREAVKAQDCHQCGAQIGMSEFVVCQDGITNKQVAFHKRCVPQMSDVQRHYGAHLNPGVLGITLKDLG